MSDPVYFNGVDLNSITGWRTTGTDPHRFPQREVTNYSLANSNKSVTTSAFYTGKTINVSGIIAVNGRELLDSSIAELRRILQAENAVLQLPVFGEQRKYFKVTTKNIALKNMGGGYVEIDIEFTSSEIYNYSITSTELLNIVNLTSGIKSYQVTVLGSGPQVPVITYTVDSFTTGTNRTVTFSNPTSGYSISIQRTWTAGEILIIDNRERTVQIAGEDVDFTGNYLEWTQGAGFINYSDDFTARQVDINVTYYKRDY